MINNDKLRWGILGAADIARKNWQAILHSGNGAITTVASRDAVRGQQFVQACQARAPFEVAPRVLGSYAELLAARDVDAVYVPLPTGLRKEWVIRAAEAGKHVVCEKPCAASVTDLRAMLDACRRHHVQFMDGVMFMHSRRLGRMRDVIDDGTSVGAVKRITAAFTFCAEGDFLDGNIRMNSRLEPHGCLGDLGWYCIRLALWVMRWQMPRQVTGRMLSQLGRSDSPVPVPTEFSGELLFDGGVSAGFYCSFVTENQQWARVSGTRGCLELPDFVLPFAGGETAFEMRNAAFGKDGCDFKMEPHSLRIAVDEHSHSHPTAQEANLFRNFADAVRSGRVEESWFEMALKTQQVMEACLTSAQREGYPMEVR